MKLGFLPITPVAIGTTMRRSRVLVLANHPATGYSMLRYSQMLSEAYGLGGFPCRTLAPTQVLSSRVTNPAAKKLLVYIENLLIFPIRAGFAAMSADRVHVADHSNAMWLLWPPLRRRALVTCHDLFAVRAARGEISEHTTRFTGRMYQWLVERGLERAALVVCDSKATQRDLARIVPKSQHTVLYCAVSPTLTEPQEAEPIPLILEKEYVLLVSSSGWRKRREHAVRVWQRLHQLSGMEQLHLVSVGPPLMEHEQVGLEPGDAEYIIQASGLTDSELAHVYRGATALIQVSRYEGFGWPIVEANAQGTPAICSDLPIFHEVSGPAGVFIDDNLDSVDWAAVKDAIADPQIMERSWSNARRFTNKRFVQELVGLHENALTQR